MAIPILSEIERLITEHGSAAILKERLAFAADQYAALEKKLSEANIRNEELQSDNDRLRLDYEECEKKRCTLEKKLSEQSPAPLPKINSGPGSWVKARRGG